MVEKEKKKIKIIGIGKLGIKRLNMIIENLGSNENTISIDVSTKELEKSLAETKILVDKCFINGELNYTGKFKISNLIEDSENTLIIGALDEYIEAELSYEVLCLAKEENIFTMVLLSYYSLDDRKYRLSLAKEFEKKILGITDIAHIIRMDKLSKMKNKDSLETNLQKIDEEVLEVFKKAYELLGANKKVENTKDNLINIENIIIDENKRKILKKILSNYNYYNRYIPREEMNLFIDFVHCYVLGEEEYVWKCEYIANVLGGMTFYNDRDIDIITLLYDLADEFK